MIRKKKESKEKPTIDLTGPNGNAFYLLGISRHYAKQLGYSEADIKQLHDTMTESDYEHLIQTFDKFFGDYVDLLR